MFAALRKLFEKGPDPVIEALQKKGSIIDVRSAGEFQTGSVKGAVNIPHTDIRSQKKKIGKLKKPIIVCCASGMRSGVAIQELKALGYNDVVNGKTVGRVAKALRDMTAA